MPNTLKELEKSLSFSEILSQAIGNPVQNRKDFDKILLDQDEVFRVVPDPDAALVDISEGRIGCWTYGEGNTVAMGAKDVKDWSIVVLLCSEGAVLACFEEGFSVGKLQNLQNKCAVLFDKQEFAVYLFRSCDYEENKYTWKDDSSANMLVDTVKIMASGPERFHDLKYLSESDSVVLIWIRENLRANGTGKRPVIQFNAVDQVGALGPWVIGATEANV